MEGSIVILDTETTGLPQERGYRIMYPPKDFKRYDSGRLIQLAYRIYHPNMKLNRKLCYTIEPEGFKVLPHMFNNVTKEQLRNGKEMIKVLKQFKRDILHFKVEKCIIYNVPFDKNVIESKYFRKGLGIKFFHQLEFIDLMDLMKPICKARKMNGEIKDPKLIEAYEYCFPDEEEIDDWHSADFDTRQTAKIYKWYLEHPRSDSSDDDDFWDDFF